MKPDYNYKCEFIKGNAQDEKWNINVLLMMRRANIIAIDEIDEADQNYQITIRILDNRLTIKNKEMEDLFERIRSDESVAAYKAFSNLRKSIEYANEFCWSDMFTSTYSLVSDYCAGCNSHEKPEYDFPDRFPLLEAVEGLRKEPNDFCSVMHVNNETGMIQPVKEIGDELAGENVFFHVDATQSCGKMVEEIKALNYDMLSLSAHKFQGPQGIGALVLKRKKYRLPPVKNIMFGGQQEHGLRPGTTPVALAAGLGKASVLALSNYRENFRHCNEIKSVLIEELNESGVHFQFNGDQDYCSVNTINLQFIGVSSEALMISTKQYCGLSNGSACTSKDYSPSYVLKAMGLTDEEAYNSVRISWGPDTDLESVRDNFNQLLQIVKNFQ